MPAINVRRRMILAGAVGIISASVLVMTQTPVLVGRYTASTSNVSGAGDSVRFEVLKWSTDAERDQLVTAWTHPNPPAPPPAAAPAPPPATVAGGGGGARGGGGGGARGGGAAAGGAAPALPPVAAAGDAPVPAAAGAAGGGRGGRGGAAGGGRGAAPAPVALPEVPPETPESALLTAVQKTPSAGILWTSESAGYSLKLAYRIAQPDGGERILFITDRRLGTWSDQWWKPTVGTPTNYGFTVIEFRLNSKGEGEGRTSLTGKVIEDPAVKSIALENYDAQPVVFKAVKKVR